MQPDDTSPPLKICSKCGTAKLATAEFFFRAKAGRYGLKSSCKLCSNAAVVTWRRESGYDKAWRLAHLAKCLAKERTYRERHRDEIASRSKGRRGPARREWERRWRAANPGKASRAHHDWMARKLGNGGTHGPGDVVQQYRRQRGRCYWCGVDVGTTYHVDHVIPVSKGGSNDPSNIVIACPTCNRSKSNRLPHEFSDRLC